MRILFDSRLSQFKSPFGTLHPGQDCRIQIQIPVSCQTVKTELVLLQEDGTQLQREEMEKCEQTELYETWRCNFCLTQPALYFYYFHITTQNESFRLLKQGSDTNMESGDWWQVSVVDGKYQVPEWARGAVMYQIFPDRFAADGKCDCTDKLKPYWVHENTDDMPVYLPNEKGEVLNNDFYGGNLNGIREKLPYLHELGVQILYLNPIFMAFSTHRYDTYDYKRVDPMLGTEKDFTALCDTAHALGMRVILDGVFSHVGDRSEYFQQAIHDPESPYCKWFDFKHYPDVYTSWWGITTLPCINKLEESYVNYIIEDEDSVVAKWLRLGADGYRLDVVDELPDVFVAKLRRRIREIKPDALLIGEVWEDASNKIAYDKRRRYFVDCELDSVMNYPWQKAILRYARGEDDGRELGERIMQLAENYPPDVLGCVMNLLGTHDTPRALTALIDSSDADRAELARRHMSDEQRERGKRLLRLAAFLEFTLPGMACIYYGDEAGMEGYRDPFNRKFYPWGREDTALQQFYRELAGLKRDNPALRCGDITVLESGGGRIMFLRRCNEQSVVICCNQSHEPWSVRHSGRLLFGGNLSEYMPKTVTLARGGYCVMEK